VDSFDKLSSPLITLKMPPKRIHVDTEQHQHDEYKSPTIHESIEEVNENTQHSSTG
jgi:hypothetical protein